jgi:hypothetical protein
VVQVLRLATSLGHDEVERHFEDKYLEDLTGPPKEYHFDVEQLFDTNFLFVWQATALLAGDHPYRDFFEWGIPLQAVLFAIGVFIMATFIRAAQRVEPFTRRA